MVLRNILLIFGSLLPLLSSVVYVASIVRGKTKPQRMTRLLLTLITGLSFFALLVAGDTSGVWLALASLVQAVAIYALSFRFGIGGTDKLDMACFALCAAGVAVWLATGQSFVGLAAAIVSDAIAIVPSFIKTWRLPHTENWAFYFLDCIAAICIVLAGPYNLASVIFPLYILLVNAAFVWAIVVRPGAVVKQI